ncbi:hypothetical protein GCM10009560_41100 [Nonomuraea longicatena]|uniref:Uncharacterized protein n=1 Tax=Nonomuraea longicatena TaxID=83682 RepID=A0ABP4AEN2_9ACTN
MKAWVRVLLNASGGTLVIRPLFSRSSDSFGVMYRARSRPGDLAGYHRETMSSRAFTDGTQGSEREVSCRYRKVVPTGREPVGSGRRSVPFGVEEGPAEALPDCAASDVDGAVLDCAASGVDTAVPGCAVSEVDRAVPGCVDRVSTDSAVLDVDGVPTDSADAVDVVAT